MPSRRDILAAGATAVGSAIAGCLSETGTTSADLLQLKAISVEWRHDGRSHSDQILRLVSDGEREIAGEVATVYGDAVADPTEVAASMEVHDDLRSRFETVRYVVGFCGNGFGSDDGCLNTETSREDFNAVQFGDRAEVELNDDRFLVREVHSEDDRKWDADVGEFEWADRHSYPEW